MDAQARSDASEEIQKAKRADEKEAAGQGYSCKRIESEKFQAEEEAGKTDIEKKKADMNAILLQVDDLNAQFRAEVHADDGNNPTGTLSAAAEKARQKRQKEFSENDAVVIGIDELLQPMGHKTSPSALEALQDTGDDFSDWIKEDPVYQTVEKIDQGIGKGVEAVGN